MYMYKTDLALDNLQWLICHKTKPNFNQEIPLKKMSIGNHNRGKEEMQQ